MTVKIKIIKKAKKEQDRAPTFGHIAVANAVEKGGRINKGQILKAAGYGTGTQKNPKRIFDKPYVRRKIDAVVKDMEAERDAILKLMKKKRGKANYVALSITLKNMNHDIELLEGRPTERDDGGLDAKEKADLQALLARHRKK